MKRITLLCLCLLLCCAAPGALAEGYAARVVGAPGAPTSLIASSGYRNIALNWLINADNGGSELERHEVYRNGNWYADVAGNENSLTDNNVVDGTTYTYKVRAYNGTFYSDFSNEVTAMPQGIGNRPDAPVLTAVAGVGMVTLSWTKPDDGGDAITGYTLTRDGVEIAHPGPDDTEYVDTNVDNGRTHTYALVAWNGEGASQPGTASATPKAGPSTGDGDSYADTPAKQPEYQQAVVVNVCAHCNVREGPGTAYPIVGQAALGEPLQLLRWSADGQWCEVLYAGGTQLGWIYHEFIGA